MPGLTGNGYEHGAVAQWSAAGIWLTQRVLRSQLRVSAGITPASPVPNSGGTVVQFAPRCPFRMAQCCGGSTISTSSTTGSSRCAKRRRVASTAVPVSRISTAFARADAASQGYEVAT